MNNNNSIPSSSIDILPNSNTTLQFHESPCYNSDSTSRMIMPPPTDISQNQSMTSDNPTGEKCKSKADIIYENYVKEYTAVNDDNPYLLNSNNVDQLSNYNYLAPTVTEFSKFSEFEHYFNSNDDENFEMKLSDLFGELSPLPLQYIRDHFLSYNHHNNLGSPMNSNSQSLMLLSLPPNEAVANESNLQFLPPPLTLPQNEVVAIENNLQFSSFSPPLPNVAVESNLSFMSLQPPPLDEAVATEIDGRLLPLMSPPFPNEAIVVESNLQLSPLSNEVVRVENNLLWSSQLPPLPTETVAIVNDEATSLKIKKEWSAYEHGLFLIGMVIFKKGEWKNIATEVIMTKSYKQVASHAQKFFKRQELPMEKRKRPSIHDITTFDPELLMQVCNRLKRPPPSMPNSFE